MTSTGWRYCSQFIMFPINLTDNTMKATVSEATGNIIYSILYPLISLLYINIICIFHSDREH